MALHKWTELSKQTDLQKAVVLAPESESGHHRAATAVATAVRARSGASDSSHSKTDLLSVAAPAEYRLSSIDVADAWK